MEQTNKNRMNRNCTGNGERLADMLLNPAAVPAKVQAHVDQCDHCQSELAELKATMALLDDWKDPEPSPYFLTRLDSKMREERQAEPVGWPANWIARVRARFLYGPQTLVRPLAAMALTIMLLLGGGTYLGVTDWDRTTQPAGQAQVVGDLVTLDNNAQLLDQMELLSDSDNGE
jgi:hypothetical protein